MGASGVRGSAVACAFVTAVVGCFFAVYAVKVDDWSSRRRPKTAERLSRMDCCSSSSAEVVGAPIEDEEIEAPSMLLSS